MIESNDYEQDESADIRYLMREGTAIDQAIIQAVREAILDHKRAGNPIVVGDNGQVVWIPPEDIDI